ncbi:hypothetical protein OIU84_011948 [Salix udensis]|uniref:Leucine-rich repeat-containing N-terminal plant-type domain-containing protein n=1 Tax=Salix udensis TaxID=889485 RepID=A0AAD6NSP3_9ROSI|nr:hypothetical protein OIU84_011948 [Salix udensis]
MMACHFKLLAITTAEVEECAYIQQDWESWFCCSTVASGIVSAVVVEKKVLGDQVSALLSLKAGLVDPLNSLRDWKLSNSSAHCNWAGVRCNLNGAVEKLDLSHMNLSGHVSDDIQRLESLTSLNLCCNGFSSSLTKAISNLTSLKDIDVSQNLFIGIFPAGLGRAAGGIPAEFGNLTNLKYLDLAVGNLSGEIPAELGRLKALETVFLYQNNLEGELPAAIGNITSLQLLDLSENNLSGEIPAEIVNLKNLQLLNLMSNKLSGSVPAGVGGLTQLAVLELWNNSLSGPLPRDLGKNSPLQWLDVSSNSLSGEIPASLCNGGNLTKLILFNNSFSVGLGKLGKLQRLELANNSLTVLSIQNLQTFMASNNNFEGEIPDQFQDRPSLSSLDLSSNQFSGSIPATIASCEKLVNLNLKNNRLTGEIPKAVATMPALAVLDLSNNSLTGRLPENFGSSPALEMLNVSHNKLEGPVPANGVLRTINPADLVGNAGLCGGVLPPCSHSLQNASGAKKCAYKARSCRMARWDFISFSSWDCVSRCSTSL